MLTNTPITIYNKYVDPDARVEVCQRTVIARASFESRKAANGIQSGYLASNTARIFIPMSEGANYVKPKAWLALEDKAGSWTLKDGDIVIKGAVEDEIDEDFRLTALQAKYDDYFVITSVDTMDRGSTGIQHWEVGCK